MANIIIPSGNKMGKTRSEQEIQLRKEWGGTMSDEQLDNLKYLERKRKQVHGFTGSFFIGLEDVDDVK